MANETDPEAAGSSIESRIRRLDDIAAALERDDIELDDALALFEEGIAHLRAAKQLLAHAQLRVERLVTELGGEARVEPLGGGSE